MWFVGEIHLARRLIKIRWLALLRNYLTPITKGEALLQQMIRFIMPIVCSLYLLYPVKNDTIHFQGAHIKFRVFLHGAYSSATSTRSNPSAYYIRINQLPPTYNFALQSLKLPHCL